MKKQTKATSGSWKNKALVIIAVAFLVWVFWPQDQPHNKPALGTVPQPAPTPGKTFNTQEALDYFQKLAALAYPDSQENSYFSLFMKQRLRWIYSASKEYQES